MALTWTVRPLSHLWTSKTEAGKRTGTTVYQCIASEPSTPYAAERAVDSVTGATPPTIGLSYPGTTGVPCVGRQGAATDQTRLHFQVTSDYDSTSTFTANPLSEPLKVSYGPETSDESYFKDKATPAVYAVTTAGEPFNELPKRKAGHLNISISKNVDPDTNYSAYEAFCDEDGLLTNDGPVTIDGRTYAAGTLLALPPELSEVKDQDGTRFRTLTTSLMANASGWNQTYESRGLYEWDIVTGDIVRILDGNKDPVEVAVPLDELGAALSPDDTGFEIEMQPYDDGDFSVLV